MNEPAYETVSSFREESRGARNMNNPVYCYSSESGIAASIGDSGYAKIGQTSRNQVTRLGYVTTAGGLNPRNIPSLHPQISESASSMAQVPSPYLLPQPSFGKDSQIIKEYYEMQVTTDLKQLTSGRNTTSYINTHVVPTDPQTGYSTLLRTDRVPQQCSAKLNPMDPLYDSIKEKTKCFLVGSDEDKLVAKKSRPSSVPPLHAELQTAFSSNNQGRPVTTRSCVAEVFSSEIVDDPETGYSVLKSDKPIPGPPPGVGCDSVPPYDTIKLNNSYSVELQNNVSYASTLGMHTPSPSHNDAAIQLGEPR